MCFFPRFRAWTAGVLLASGHVEHDGLVVANRRREPQDNPPAREPANRLNHADDE
jgi:hypothetical protein